ncbi:hypothetical protein ABE137_12425 [Brevibacillus laterosporus]|uniref:hypothetical protein n=1 Tax=Brevibacillus phage Sundance TaxID=1691958 RepID=UPI0006BD376C|nr:hypothetical protein AVT09_gp164 [Brevibacillus phage Sundance]ALA47980.1 hypothetical protein SUNDANCE_164 [Brevibacillus phage Sundance]
MDKHDMIKAIQIIADRSKKLKPIIDEIVRDKGGFDAMSNQDVNELYMFCINSQFK